MEGREFTNCFFIGIGGFLFWRIFYIGIVSFGFYRNRLGEVEGLVKRKVYKKNLLKMMWLF